MFYGVMCSDTRLLRPAYAWTQEHITEKENSVEKVTEINAYWQRRSEEKRAQAYIPGTEEYQYIEDLNKQIREGKHPKWKRERGPHQEFKPEKFERGCLKENDTSKGGIDWFLYREKILLPILYPYIKKVQELNPDKKVWFVDDNVGLHGKAHRSLADIAKAMGIERIPFWPPNSPDLHPIENSFDYLKDLAEEFYLRGSSAAEKLSAGRYLIHNWQYCIDGIVKHLCLSFKDKLELCRAYEGKNNFRA